MSPKKRFVILIVVLEVLFVVAIVALSGCGDDDSQTAREGTNTTAKGADKPDAGDGDDDGDEEPALPPLRTFASDRAEGLKASAQADGLARRPKEIWLRVSAAPKQKVRVTWNLTCGKGGSPLDDYVITPPDIRKLPLPVKNAPVCPVSVAAQLSGTGRLKVALLRDP